MKSDLKCGSVGMLFYYGLRYAWVDTALLTEQAFTVLYASLGTILVAHQAPNTWQWFTGCTVASR